MTTRTVTPPTENAAVPADALTFSNTMQFGEHETSDDLPNVFPVTFFARSAEAIYHPYWGRIIHDMDGMTHNDTISIDFNHDTLYSDVGYVDKFDAGHNGLTLSGGLISLQKHDQAWSIFHKGKLKFPWKSSIDFGSNDPDELQFQFVDEFEAVEVNGGIFEGPGYVVRKWPLNGVAITQRGVDSQANVQFSESRTGDVPVTVFHKPKDPVMNDATDNADDGKNTPETPGGKNTQLSEPASAAVVTPGAITPETLTKFSAEFGNEKGMEYLAAGLNLEAARLQFAQHKVTIAEAAVTKITEERDELQTQLSAATEQLKQFGAGLGQSAPLDTGTDAGDKSEGARAVDMIKQRRATRFSG